MGRTGKRQAVEEPSDVGESSVRRGVQPRESVATAMMTPESHPWLKWSGCNANRKLELNNKLATFQNRAINPPRIMDWEVLNVLEIVEETDTMFLTRNEFHGRVLEIPIWKRALDVREDCYRELCLEFFSSISVVKSVAVTEIATTEIIHFRLGGQEHSVTLPRFGELTDLFRPEDLADREGLVSYLQRGEKGSSDFLEHVNDFWQELTDLPAHSKTSKIKEVNFPILRVIHKMLTYSVSHRSSQQDKVYTDDLWLLYRFHQQDPHQYVNVPLVLACFLETKAAGKQRDSQICGGNFVTRIARNLRLLTQTNIRSFSPPIKCRSITMHDLVMSKLIDPATHRLIQGPSIPGKPPVQLEQQPEQQQQPGGDPVLDAIAGLSTQMVQLGHQLGRMGRAFGQRFDRVERRIDEVADFVDYHWQRYQPSMDFYGQRHAKEHGNYPWMPYEPPTWDPQFRSQQQDKNEDDHEE